MARLLSPQEHQPDSGAASRPYQLLHVRAQAEWQRQRQQLGTEHVGCARGRFAQDAAQSAGLATAHVCSNRLGEGDHAVARMLRHI